MSVDVVKGFTKMQCLMFTLLSAADLDLNQPETMKLLEPLYPVLDKAWMIPCHAPQQNCGLLGGVFIVWVTDSITPTLYHLQLITLIGYISTCISTLKDCKNGFTYNLEFV